MIWIREIMRAVAIVLWVLVMWTACSIVSQEVAGWHIEMAP